MYQYIQTIPLNSKGLDVTFDLDITLNVDRTVNIKGMTNFFDKASVMISLRNASGVLMAHNKSLVEKGQFDFERLGKKGKGFNNGKYSVDISLAIPSVQKKEFVAKAGIEYEN